MKLKNNEILIFERTEQSKKPSIRFISWSAGLYSYSEVGLISGTETTSGSIALTLTIPIFSTKVRQ